MAQVAIHIVTYNGLKYLPELFASIAQQAFRNTHIRILDNASTDGTSEWLKKYTHRFFPYAELTLDKINIKFVGGHNTLFKKTTEQYVQLINQDTILEPEYIEKLVSHLQNHPHDAAAAGIIFELSSKGKPYLQIDSAGLHLHRSRKCTEHRSGEHVDARMLPHWPIKCEVIGVSGTLPMYRTHAVRTIDKHLFDPQFEMYKEDVDLARRLQADGWKSHIVPSAQAYHDRTVAQHIARSNRSHQARYCSYRNHLYLLRKHETPHSFMRDLFHIIPHEIAKFFYLLFCEPRVLLAWRDVFKHWNRLRPLKPKEQKHEFTVSHKYLATHT